MTVLSDRFEDATAYASLVLRGQRRKGIEHPYVRHLLSLSH